MRFLAASFHAPNTAAGADDKPHAGRSGPAARAAFYAMCDTVKEVRRLQMVLGGVGFPQPPRRYCKSVGEPGVKITGTIMFEDHVSSMGVGKHDGFSSKTRVILIYVSSLFKIGSRGFMSIIFCPTT